MKTIYRNSETGLFCSKEYAEANPATTTKETINEHLQVQTTSIRNGIIELIESIDAVGAVSPLQDNFKHDLELLKAIL